MAFSLPDFERSDQRLVFGLVQPRPNEGGDVCRLGNTRKIALEDHFRNPCHCVCLGFEDRALGRIDQPGIPLGLGDLLRDGAGGRNESRQ